MELIMLSGKVIEGYWSCHSIDFLFLNTFSGLVVKVILKSFKILPVRGAWYLCNLEQLE